MTSTIDDTTIVSPDTLAAGGRAIAAAFGLGDSTMPSNDWPVDDGDTSFVVDIAGDISGRLFLAVNDEVGGRLGSDHDRLRSGFRKAIDAMLEAAGIQADVELGEISATEDRPTGSVEIYDGKQMCALFGAKLGASGDDADEPADGVDDGADAASAATDAPVFEPAALTGAAGGIAGVASGPLSLLHDVEMDVTVELGRTSMPIRELLSLQPGMVIEIDRQAGTPIDVLVNGRLIACGEVVVIDEEFGVRITEIVEAGARL